MTPETTLSIAMIISVLSIIFTGITFFRNNNKETRADAVKRNTEIAALEKQLLTLDIKMDSLQTLLSEIRNDLRDNMKRIQILETELVSVKSDLARAFEQIEEVKVKLEVR